MGSRKLCLPLLALFALPGVALQAATTTIPEALHEQCLQAADYIGCVKANNSSFSLQQSGPDRFGLPVPADTVAHQRRDGTISYFAPNSVAAVRNKDSYGRYITWTYTYHYNRASTPGYWTAGQQQCTKVGQIRTCRQVGQRYIPGERGGPTSRTWRVFADCKDYTAKWHRDGRPWQSIHRGERHFETEKLEEAREVLNSYCSRMDSLPRSSLTI